MLILLGKPASGKTTIANMIAEMYSLNVVSFGVILREKAKTDKEIADVVNSGGLVNDTQALSILNEYVHNDPNVLIDGYPRQMSQAKLLNEGLINKVIELSCKDENVLNRCASRGRHDDDETTVNKRLKVYYDQSKEVIDYYESQGKLFTIDASLPIELVFSQVKKIM